MTVVVVHCVVVVIITPEASMLVMADPGTVLTDIIAEPMAPEMLVVAVLTVAGTVVVEAL